MRKGIAGALFTFWVCLVWAASPKVVYTFDAVPWNRADLGKRDQAEQLWDRMHLLAAVQGLANRAEASLYIFYCEEFGVQTDRFWIEWLRQTDGWLKHSQLMELQDLDQVLNTFRDHYKGLVVYDPKVPATAVVASTAAGCESLLPVRYDPKEGSLFLHLTRTSNLPVKLWLVGEDGASIFSGKGKLPRSSRTASGSAKVDAHRWALERFLKQCSPGIAAHYIDSFWVEKPRQAGPTMHTLSNHDYFIARRGFFFDLSPWGDEAPNDEPGQPVGLDRQALLETLHSLYQHSAGNMIQVGGFPPWPYKYTDAASKTCKHEPVPTEWEFSRIISEFNGYMEADAAGLGAMANASFYQHYPLKSSYIQKSRRPVQADWARRGLLTRDGKVRPGLYLGHYVGDYDSPSWLYKAVPAFFQDIHRGEVPLGWAFNPNLSIRAPHALVYAYAEATTNDFFIAGDSGAGYLNARALTVRPLSKLPSGLAIWEQHCRKHFKQWDMDITGFILDGAGGRSTAVEFARYATFSPHGAGTHFEAGPALYAGIPTCPERDLPDDVGHAAEIIAAAAANNKGEPRFFWARSILKSPGWYTELSKLLETRHAEAGVTTVDPYTFFGLLRESANQAARK